MGVVVLALWIWGFVVSCCSLFSVFFFFLSADLVGRFVFLYEASFGSATSASLGVVVSGVVALVCLGLYCFSFCIICCYAIGFLFWIRDWLVHWWPLGLVS
jgi:hypothetical protein